jgi:hypothetical protein
MESAKHNLKWIRHSSYQSDFVHGCPPKVDSPSRSEFVHGCPPKVDSPSVTAWTIDVPRGCPPKVD